MTDSDDIETLAAILSKVEALVAGVRPDQLDDPTPCPGMDVRAMVNHIVGFMQNFAAAAQGRKAGFNPADVVSADPVKDVRVAAEQTISGWRELGTDREVSVTGPPSPGPMVLGMTIIEYVAHGSDLAMATGQQIPFTEAEAGLALAKGQATLTDEYRGEGMPFGERIDVPDEAPMIDRFLGFMGRRAPAGQT